MGSGPGAPLKSVPEGAASGAALEARANAASEETADAVSPESAAMSTAEGPVLQPKLRLAEPTPASESKSGVVPLAQERSGADPSAPEEASTLGDPGLAGESSPPSGAAEAPDAETINVTKGTVVAGKYRLERLLKAGGMGAVWVATHLTLDTPVAIKFMAIPAADDDGPSSKKGHSSDAGGISRARFEREARTAAQIRSANVVQILDYGVDRATAYIVMELLDGEDLLQRLRNNARVPLDQTVKIIVPVLHLLQRAHDVGMVHRDLKPGNIFLAKDGDTEVPKVLDFGVAKAVATAVEKSRADNDLTAETTIIGTPHYASPEQLKSSAKIDHRADLWSMGVVLFRMLTGRKPFRAGPLMEAIVEVCTAPIPTATSIAPDLPAEVDAFFARALARDLDERFQSAREMAQALTVLGNVVNAGEWLSSADLEVTTDDPGDAAKPASTTTPSVGDTRSAPATQLTPSTTGGSADARERRPAWLLPALVAVALGALVPVAVLALQRQKAPEAATAASPSAPVAGAAPSALPVQTPAVGAAAEAHTPVTPDSSSALPAGSPSPTGDAGVDAAPRPTAPGWDPAHPTYRPRPLGTARGGAAPNARPTDKATSKPKTPVSSEDKEVGY
jgi:eukaryotic-like serine/threonine-protein kinase